jgi:hypothetical protein
MPAQHPSAPNPPVQDPSPDPPANRAARRAGRSADPVPSTVRYRGSAAPPRPAQGRRVLPVRRTG